MHTSQDDPFIVPKMSALKADMELKLPGKAFFPKNFGKMTESQIIFGEYVRELLQRSLWGIAN